MRCVCGAGNPPRALPGCAFPNTTKIILFKNGDVRFMESAKKVWTPEEVAGVLQCSRKTVIKLARAGELPALRVGDLWRFSAEAIHRWIQGDTLAAV